MIEIISWALWAIGAALLVSWAHDDGTPEWFRVARECKARGLSAARVRNRF